MPERTVSRKTTESRGFELLLDHATNYGGDLIHAEGSCYDCDFEFEVDWNHRGGAQRLCREHANETGHRVELILGYIYRPEEGPDD